MKGRLIKNVDINGTKRAEDTNLHSQVLEADARKTQQIVW